VQRRYPGSVILTFTVSPVEEALSTLNDLVESGKFATSPAQISPAGT